MNASLSPMAPALAPFAHLPRWVAWRNEQRNGRETKIPYGRAGQHAKADDPATWLGLREAQSLAGRIVNGTGGGIGIELGKLPDGRVLGGVDLDSCLAAERTLSPWASAVLDRLASYSEISPSGGGIKVFYTVPAADLEDLQALIGDKLGRTFREPGGGDHGPAIELHLGGRYYTVTGRAWPGMADLRHVEASSIRWIIEEAGPALARKPAVERAKAPLGIAHDAGASDPSILPRLETLVRNSPPVARAVAGLAAHGSRSEAALALAGALRRAGWDYASVCAALRARPETAGWMAEKGEAGGGRELQRLWEKVGDGDATKASAPPRTPAMSILRRSASAPPALPMAVFDPFWSDWIERAARGANAPLDYVALPLLALASSLLGNSRWVVAWHGWAEPPALWCASVGNPSSGKSSGAAPVNRDVLAKIEQHACRDYPRDVEQWETVASVGKAVLKQWEKDTAKAVKDKKPVPEKPPEATIPPKPIRPRVRVADVTVEKLASILETVPKGVLYVRDELASWLLNLSRYANGGSDRPFWLEAYVGGPMQVDRVKNPDPVFIPHLTVPVFGTIQPERLADVLAEADDGLPSRFLWAWPEAKPFAQPTDAGDADAAASRLLLLAELVMATNETGQKMPCYVHLAEDARPVLADFAREMQEREHTAHGLMKSTIGKARGQALRLAVNLEYLWWCGDGAGTAEPRRVSRRAMQAACGLMDAYFLPMAARVMGDVSVPADERNARTLATWIIETRPERVNVSSIRDGARLPGLRESDPVKDACRFLVEAGWLIEPPATGGRGRPRDDFMVNPLVWEASP